jgi:outer membrane immunogenic protein
MATEIAEAADGLMSFCSSRRQSRNSGLMMKTVVVTAIALLTAAPALAADFAVRAAPAAAPIVASWSGLYIGGNIGYGVGHNPTSLDNFQGLPPVNVGAFTLSPAGIIGGSQIGSRWQFAPAWVVGVEADIQASGQKDKACLGQPLCDIDASGRIVPSSLRLEQKIDWFGTARATVGWANDGYLWYLTGGYAYGKVSSSTTDVVNPNIVFRSGSASSVRSGWTAGGGIETRLWQSNWSVKLEYLYVDLGSQSYDMLTAVAAQPTHSPTTSDIHDHIIRAGANYKLDWGAPVTAKY